MHTTAAGPVLELTLDRPEKLNATAMSKTYANTALTGSSLAAARDALEHLIEHTLFGAEAVEGLNAFSSRRQPQFSTGARARSRPSTAVDGPGTPGTPQQMGT